MSTTDPDLTKLLAGESMTDGEKETVRDKLTATDVHLALTASTTGVPDALHNGTITGTLAVPTALTTDATTKTNLRNAAGLGTTDNVQHAAVTGTTGTFSAFTIGALDIKANLVGASVQVSNGGMFRFGGAGNRIYDIGGAVTIRNGSNTANAPLACSNLTASGTVKTGSQTAAGAIAYGHITAVAAGVGAQTFISDTGKPAWAHGSPAVWKYADGTTVT